MKWHGHWRRDAVTQDREGGNVPYVRSNLQSANLATGSAGSDFTSSIWVECTSRPGFIYILQLPVSCRRGSEILENIRRATRALAD